MLWKGFENKSHQRRGHYLKPCRNSRPIPTLARVKEHKNVKGALENIKSKKPCQAGVLE